MDLLIESEAGLYCPLGDFHIDPMRPVKHALITHGHSDHARRGSAHYLTHKDGMGILQERLGKTISVAGVSYEESVKLGETKVSFHPAGHILGSAQIRIEAKGEVWVFSGDYKLHSDGTCVPFTPVRCHTFVTESTFALPMYHWEPESQIKKQIQSFVVQNQRENKLTILCGYSLGKAQRLLQAVTADQIYVSSSCYRICKEYEKAGIQFFPYQEFKGNESKSDLEKAVLVTPPQTIPLDFLHDLGIEFEAAFASGWMSQSKSNLGSSFSKGFAMSDHADWEGLNLAVKESNAENILVHHGYSVPWVKYLKEKGTNARIFPKSKHDITD